MLSLFPQILFLSPFAATLLRITAGIIFIISAWNHYSARDKLGKEQFIAIGHGMWIPLLIAGIELLVGVALILGAYTQGAAIVGALLAMKAFVWEGAYPDFFPLSRTTNILLCVICLSLVVTGAGIFAFDLPL